MSKYKVIIFFIFIFCLIISCSPPDSGGSKGGDPDGSSNPKTIAVTDINLFKTETYTCPAVSDEDKETLYVDILPSDATNKILKWMSSNIEIVKVDANGKITGVAAGQAEVTVKTTDGSNLSDTCTVHVSESETPVNSVKLSCTSMIIPIGKNRRLIAQIDPITATNQKLLWTSSNTSIAEVDHYGLIKAKSVGDIAITVTMCGGKTAACDVTVTSDTTPPDEVADLSAVPGNGKVTLTWTDPSDTDFSHVEIFEVSNESNGSASGSYGVSKGVQTVIITGLTNGTAYEYKIKTVDRAGNTSVGKTISATPEGSSFPSDMTPPDEVADLSAVPGNGKVTLTWTDPSVDDFSYVEISEVSNASGSYGVSKGVQTAIITGLTNGTTYEYIVKTVDKTGNKSDGKTISATPTGS